MSQIRFYTDEHVAYAVIAGLRRRGVDVLTTQEAQMRGKSDAEQLAFATMQERVLVTQDDDFLRLHAQGIQHSGIAYVPPQASIGHIVRGLMLIYQVLDAGEMQNHVEVV